MSSTTTTQCPDSSPSTHHQQCCKLMNLPPPHLPPSITLSPTPCSPPCPAFCNWMDVLLLCSVVVGAVSTTLLLSGLLIYRQKESCLFSSYTETLKKSIEKMFCKEQLNIYILHFHEDCGGLNSSIYMVNFLNYFPKANVFLKASLIDCWLWNSFYWNVAHLTGDWLSAGT